MAWTETAQDFSHAEIVTALKMDQLAGNLAHVRDQANFPQLVGGQLLGPTLVSEVDVRVVLRLDGTVLHAGTGKAHDTVHDDHVADLDISASADGLHSLEIGFQAWDPVGSDWDDHWVVKVRIRKAPDMLHLSAWWDNWKVGSSTYGGVSVIGHREAQGW